MADNPRIKADPPRRARLAAAPAQGYLLVAGAGLVLLGQLVLTRAAPNRPGEVWLQLLSAALSLAGACLFGAAAGSTGPALPDAPPEVQVLPGQARRVWRTAWTITAVILAVLAAGLFARSGENASIRILWGASMLSLLAAHVQRIRVQRPAPAERIYLLGLLFLLVITLITRSYRLTMLPYNVDGDFASVGLQARALANGAETQIFKYGWANIPMLGYLPPVITMLFFGDGLAGLNASGVIEGALIILAVFLLGRELFHPRVSLIAAALLTISYTHLAASRQSSYIDPVLFLAFSIYFLVLGLRKEQPAAVVVSGVLTALCLQMYYSGRIILFIILFFLVFLFLFHRDWLLARTGLMALWGLAVLVALGPMLVVIFRGLDDFLSRTRDVFILSPHIVTHMQGVYHVQTIPAMLLEQVRHSLFMFNYYYDTGTQYAIRRPFLDAFTAPLFILGIGMALFHWRRMGETLLLLWISLVLVVGCFLTANPPFWARMMVLLPATSLLAALALNLLYEQAVQRMEERGYPWVRLLSAISLAAVFFYMGVLNWQTYLNMKGTSATPRTRIGRYLAKQPAGTRAVLVSTDFMAGDREFEFLAPGRLVANLSAEEMQAGNLGDGSAGLFILGSEQGRLVEWLRQYYPAASFQEYRGNTTNETAFYVFRLP